MIIARVEGNATATQRHPSLQGQRLLICQPIDPNGVPVGVPWLVIDPLGAHLHQRVIVSTDGGATRDYVKDRKSPLRDMIVAIVDEEVEAK